MLIQVTPVFLEGSFVFSRCTEDRTAPRVGFSLDLPVVGTRVLPSHRSASRNMYTAGLGRKPSGKDISGTCTELEPSCAFGWRSSLSCGQPSPALHPDPLLPALQQDTGSRGSSGGRERLIVEPPLPQEKAGGPAIPSHLLSTPYPFGISPSPVVQDSRFPPLK